MKKEHGVQGHSINGVIEMAVKTLRRESVEDVLRFTSGKGFDDGQMKDKPPVLVPVFGLALADTERVLRLLYQAQLLTAGFRPVIFTDMNIMSSVRPYGWVLEHHMSEYDAASLDSSDGWLGSVIRHAEWIVDFYRIENVVIPDVFDDLRRFARRLNEITGSDTVTPTKFGPSSVTEVVGWRSWVPGPHLPSRVYSVVAQGASAVRVEVEGGSNENLLIIDGPVESNDFSEFVDAAKDRDWPAIRTESLAVLDNVELEIAVRSLIAFGIEEGTVVLFCSAELLGRIEKIVSDERVVLRATDSAPLPTGSPDRLSMPDIELMTTIRRASRAFTG